MFYVAYDLASNIVITRYDTEIAPLPDPLPSGTAVIEVPDQATMLSTTAPGWTVQNGVLVAPPPPSAAELLAQAQTAQIALIQNSANLAKTAPMSFTNGAGNTSSFPMDPVHQTEYLGAYSAFVLGGETLPSGFGFEDVNSVIIPMAVADIKAFYAQGVAGINAITAKKATLVSQINQATSVSAVQAIVY